MELATLYRLNFITLARWAGLAEAGGGNANADETLKALVRLALQLDPAQRSEVLAYIDGYCIGRAPDAQKDSDRIRVLVAGARRGTP